MRIQPRPTNINEMERQAGGGGEMKYASGASRAREMRGAIRVLAAVPLLVAVCLLCGCGGGASSGSNTQQTPASVIATIPVGIGPNAVDVNAVTNRVYVVNVGGPPATVSVIDGGTNTVIAACLWA